MATLQDMDWTGQVHAFPGIFPGLRELDHPDHGVARAYLPPSKPGWLGLLSVMDETGGGDGMSGTGLQKLAFFLLVALILYVAATGGG